MSSNPDLGHLYHDNNIRNVFTSLDAQDKLRTREINARESKSLDKYLHIMDRAKNVCRRRNEHEQRFLRDELRGIKLKTPTLKASLRQENERMKSLQHQGGPSVKFPALRSDDGSDVTSVTGTDDGSKRNLVHVSSWSIYSNAGRTRNHSAPELRFMVDSGESRYKSVLSFETKSARAPSYVRRSEQITTSLHKLLKQSKERKMKESEKTVLEVLGRGSKEELEKALFVLRGTTTGDIIEDILQHRQMLTGKKSNTKTTTSSSASLNRSYDGYENDKMSDVTDTFHFDNDITTMNDNQGLSKLLSKSETNADIDLSNMFRRDHSTMTSVMANASDKSSVAQGVHMKWTELFKAPELWKQSQQEKLRMKSNKNTLKLVTITGKRRQTLIRR